MNNLSGTFNTIAQGEVFSIGGDFPVWTRRNKVYQGGGNIPLDGLEPGTVIPAGTPVIFNGPGEDVEIVDITDAEKLPQVNGLTFDDVSVPAGCISATCAVCYDGRIYANRANGGKGLPKSLMKQLPAVEFVYEGEVPAEP
ncbi:hypothetical protein [uncultured Duncaniella sp.]|jgi:hypothetical protein|uniref:hypothetical protein n=1 Tax=uncultured Duncaniella sp. TaxID=2768039 RepID=UPI00265B0D64|nr:hypothetical protein [uncultured Duncaniella sp.]